MKRHTARSGRKLSISAIQFPAIPVRLLAAVVLLIHTIGPVSTVFAAEGCGELLKNRCEQCHYLTRVCQKIEKNLQKGFFGGVFTGSWSRTIKNMVRQGAKLTETEQEKLTQCLDDSSPEVLEVCGLKKE